MKRAYSHIFAFVALVVAVSGCSSSPGPDSISSRQRSGPGSSTCTAQCHSSSSTISPDPLVTNGTGTYGKHVAHVENSGVSCERCHFDYLNNPSHMNGTLDTPDPAVLIVYFDSTNPTGAWNGDTGPATGYCSSLYCHGSDTPAWYLTGQALSCTTCHSQAIGTRRAVAGASGDFALNFSILSHHVTGTGDPSRDQCLVCHDQSTHTSGTVRLRNADDDAISHAYDPNAAGTLEPFCLSCHDANGALATGLSGTSNPFNDGSVLGSPPYPYATRIAASWAKSYGHGSQGNHAAGSKLTCLGTGAAGTGCHGNNGAINAHGSNQQVLAAGSFRYDINFMNFATAYEYSESHFNLCFTCHAFYTAVTKEVVFGVKAGGFLDDPLNETTVDGYSTNAYGPRGYKPPYAVPGVQTLFVDHDVPADPLSDQPFWGTTSNRNLHWFHIGWMAASFRGPGECFMSADNCSGITCVNCHDVHGSNTQFGALYDELEYAHFNESGNLYSQMTLSAYYVDPYLTNYPTYCAFNCHMNQGLTRAWYSPITE